MAAERVVSRFDWTDVQNSDLSTNMLIINEGDVGREDGQGRSARVVIIEVLIEEKGVMSRDHIRKISSINLSQRSGLESSEFRKSSSRDPMKRLA